MIKKRRNQRKTLKMIRNEERAQALRAAETSLRVLRERLTVHMIETGRIFLPEGCCERKASEELIESIRKYGLLEPLTVRRTTGDDSGVGGLFALISGSRRLDALRALGHGKVPCFIYDLQAGALPYARAQALLCAKAPDVFDLSDLIKRLNEEYAPEDGKTANALCLDEKDVRSALSCAELPEEERTVCRQAELPERLIRLIAADTSLPRRRRSVAECAACVNYLCAAQDDARRAKRGAVHDLLPVVNSLMRITAQIRSAGYAAVFDHTESDEVYTLTLTVPKKSERLLELSEIKTS